MPVSTKIQMRRDTAANWTTNNPTLAGGEWGLETDTRLMKIGDGTTAWNSLSYQLGPMLDEVIATDPTGAYFDGSGFQMYGAAGNYASTPDANALDVTGDIDIRLKIKMDDWTPSETKNIFGKADGTNAGSSYRISINSAGAISLIWQSDAAGTTLSSTSSVGTGVADGATKWIRATLDVDNGAGGNDAIFYTSDDGSTWTQLGTTQTKTGTTAIYAGTKPLLIGLQFTNATANILNGTIYRAQVLNGIGGTVAFDANFETVPADSFAFTESSANAATVTLTTTRYSFGLPGAAITSNGTANSIGTNRDIYFPFSVKGKTITVKHFAFESTVAPASASTVRIGIYAADSQMQPTGGPLFDSGNISVSSIATAIYRLRVTPFTLSAGNYLLVWNYSVGFTYRYWSLTVPGFVSNTLGANTLGVWYQVTRNTAAYPTPGVKWNSRQFSSLYSGMPMLMGWS